MSHSDFTSLQEAMEGALGQLGLGVSLTTVTIHRFWSEVVGEEVARRSQPGLLRNGRLQVTVSDAVWLQQLTFLKPKILASLEARLGSRVVRELFFTVGTLSFDSPRHDSTCEGGSSTLSAEMEAHLHEVLQPIQDGECRSVLARILKRAWQGA
ncbi:MAG: DciA family protein [Candidatus Methylomirabilales bacterium]